MTDPDASGSTASPLVRREIAGVPVTWLAAQFGTPLYVYDADMIRRRIADLQAFDVVRYAQKACSNLAVLDLVRRCGALVDAVSAGEIARALAAGFPARGDPPPIVYTADIFDHAALRMVVEHGVHVNIGSPDMLDQLAAAAPGSEVTVRVNPGFGHGHSRKTNTGGEHSKHGVWHEHLEDCLIRADSLGLAVVGLHMHIGSGADFDHLARVCDAMERAARVAGRSLRSISAGGGLPVPYREGDEPIDVDRYFRLWDATRKRLEEAFGHPVRLEVEPGRYIAAESGYLIGEIRAVKRVGRNVFYLADAGFHNLARPILYGAYHPIAIAPRDDAAQRPVREVVVGGPLCESGDIFTQEEGGYVVPRPLAAAFVGDYLVIERAGAYGFVMSSNYNSQPLAAEVLLDGGQARLVRRRQTLDELMAGETIPRPGGAPEGRAPSGGR